LVWMDYKSESKRDRTERMKQPYTCDCTVGGVALLMGSLVADEGPLLGTHAFSLDVSLRDCSQ
jgi:hypothetical protein